jgi:hypothetical protein
LIEHVEIVSPQNEVLIREFCHCDTKPPKLEKPEFKEKPEKFEKPEKPEKLEKPEPKELKEKPEKFEKPEIKDGKEKPEPKEFKDGKEKPEPKEFKDGKEKPEQKEFFEGSGPKDRFEGTPKLFEGGGPKDRFEGTPKLFEGGRPGLPAGPNTPAPYGPIHAGSSLEERLRRLEAALGQSHFIQSALRPDLSGGALLNEPDADRYRR